MGRVSSVRVATTGDGSHRAGGRQSAVAGRADGLELCIPCPPAVESSPSPRLFPTDSAVRAGLAELVDAVHSKCIVERRAGSSPASGTDEGTVERDVDSAFCVSRVTADANSRIQVAIGHFVRRKVSDGDLDLPSERWGWVQFRRNHWAARRSREYSSVSYRFSPTARMSVSIRFLPTP